MPNYNLVIDSTFQPFSFERYIQPYQIYGEAYKETEQAYSDLVQQTEAWKNIATQENSPEAYAMYKKYSDELNAVVEDFSRGMTAKNRSQLTGLKARYASEIGAIDTAYKAMQAANTYREDVRKKDPNAIFIKDKYNSIDDFLGGKMADNNYISGTEIENSLLGKTYALASNKFSELTSAGVSPKDAVEQILKGNNFDVNTLMAEEVENIGAQNFDDIGKEKLLNSMRSGIVKGLGSFVEKQTLTAAQQEELNLQRKKLYEDQRQFNKGLILKGYDEQGNIDVNSPVWAAEGIKFIEDDKGNISMVSGKNEPVKLDVKKSVSQKTGKVLLLKPEQKKEEMVVKFKDLNPKDQSLVEDTFGKIFSDDFEIRKTITTKGNIYYGIHNPDLKEFDLKSEEEVTIDDVGD